jgi:hypothetical protein
MSITDDQLKNVVFTLQESLETIEQYGDQTNPVLASIRECIKIVENLRFERRG